MHDCWLDARGECRVALGVQRHCKNIGLVTVHSQHVGAVGAVPERSTPTTITLENKSIGKGSKNQ